MSNWRLEAEKASMFVELYAHACPPFSVRILITTAAIEDPNKMW
jgi:hypothetical protein